MSDGYRCECDKATQKACMGGYCDKPKLPERPKLRRFEPGPHQPLARVLAASKPNTDERERA